SLIPRPRTYSSAGLPGKAVWKNVVASWYSLSTCPFSGLTGICKPFVVLDEVERVPVCVAHEALPLASVEVHGGAGAGCVVVRPGAPALDPGGPVRWDVAAVVLEHLLGDRLEQALAHACRLG